VIVTEDPEQIRSWSAHCLRHGLYLPGRHSNACFRGEWPIRRMAVEPGVGVAMICDYPGAPGGLSIFVAEEYRFLGIGLALGKALLAGYSGPELIASTWLAEEFFQRLAVELKAVPMMRSDLAMQLEELAAMVAGWTPIVPPAVATGRVAARLRVLAREVAAGLAGPDLPPGSPTQPEIPGES
jgi:hypothetical protein